MTASTSRQLFSVLTILGALMSLTFATSPASAGEAAAVDELPPVLVGEDSFRSHPDLLGVDLESATYDRVRAAYDETSNQLAAAFVQRHDAEIELATLAAARERQVALLAAATARRDSFASLDLELQATIGELATAVFVGIDTSAIIAALEDPSSANGRARDRVLTEAVVDSLIAERSTAAENTARADATRAVAAGAIDEIDRQAGAAREKLAASIEVTKQLAPVLGQRREEVETERALAGVTGTDLTLVALDAYYRAASTTAENDPGCGIEWWALAGISRVEGQHGTYGGSELTASGDADPPIIGIALDGSNGTAVIGDSDGGLLDGDPNSDRAVGPMQFIPDTWRRFATDGNGDGEASPNNLYDAAAAAATYLCRSGRGLTSDESLRVAFFSYNRSEAYVTNVLGQARTYQALLPLGARRG